MFKLTFALLVDDSAEDALGHGLDHLGHLDTSDRDRKSVKVVLK